MLALGQSHSTPYDPMLEAPHPQIESSGPLPFKPDPKVKTMPHSTLHPATNDLVNVRAPARTPPKPEFNMLLVLSPVVPMKPPITPGSTKPYKLGRQPKDILGFLWISYSTYSTIHGKITYFRSGKETLSWTLWLGRDLRLLLLLLLRLWLLLLLLLQVLLLLLLLLLPPPRRCCYTTNNNSNCCCDCSYYYYHYY